MSNTVLTPEEQQEVHMATFHSDEYQGVNRLLAIINRLIPLAARGMTEPCPMCQNMCLTITDHETWCPTYKAFGGESVAVTSKEAFSVVKGWRDDSDGWTWVCRGPEGLWNRHPDGEWSLLSGVGFQPAGVTYGISSYRELSAEELASALSSLESHCKKEDV